MVKDVILFLKMTTTKNVKVSCILCLTKKKKKKERLEPIFISKYSCLCTAESDLDLLEFRLICDIVHFIRYFDLLHSRVIGSPIML